MVKKPAVTQENGVGQDVGGANGNNENERTNENDKLDQKEGKNDVSTAGSTNSTMASDWKNSAASITQD